MCTNGPEDKPLERKGRLVGSSGGKWEWGVAENGHRETFWVHRKVLKLDFDDDSITL